VGDTPGWLREMVSDFDLEKYVIFHGFVKKEQVLMIQSEWNAVLATSEKIYGGNHFCLPSKTFDYINSGKIILAFITPGAQQDLLRHFSQTIFFNPDSTESNTLILSDLIKGKSEIAKTIKIPEEYTREYQAKQLAELVRKYGK
jgi:glycosyltransferase involved in cell wall biosynthesis